uniref:Uncharacterized mitochondrial protein AtMg00810-like n=1 Tax=Tanacetum cinerariifolium TaxID=118510 RepID=A0A6L2N9E8_TANCI|nr:uncharacterized mitochondrial protein AtMg00810-like [Tanacetum cinerariifolium]
MSDNTTKAQCKNCFNFLASGSNSTLRTHFLIPYCEALKTVPEAGQSSMARDESLFVYNLDVVHEQFAGLVIQEGLPFNYFDNTRMTRVFQNHLQPNKQYPDHVYALDIALYGLKQAPRAWYDVLSQFRMENCNTVPTPMVEQAKLKLDLVRKPVDHTDYRSMIGSLKYVTSSRPDIMFATCMCARYQANPNEHHVSAVKMIFRYLKGTINLGLWYLKDSGFDLTAYSDADHAGCHLDQKSTSGSVQFLGDKLVCWSSKKQNCVSISTAESEYVAVFSCCAQVLWMRTQLTDYGFFYDKVPIYCDAKNAIAISCNSVQHTRTKHIDVRFRIENCDTVPTSMVEQAKLKLDLVGKLIDHTDYQSMIGSLMYVTSSRPDIMFSTCMCARYQANPNEHHVSAVKKIFRYLKGTINIGLWYPKDSGFDLTAYSDADHAGCHLDRKSTSGSVQFLGDKLHTRTKHIDVRYHFIKDHVEKGTIELYFIGTEHQLVDLFTKSLPEARFKFLVEKLGIMSREA